MKMKIAIRSIYLLIFVGIIMAAQPASAVDSGGTVYDDICMQRIFMGPDATVSNSNRVNCTANDISLSDVISVDPTTCIAGSTFDLTATFEVTVTANSRYDAGFFFRIDGGPNARGDGSNASGSCSLSWLDIPPAVPGLNLDGDTCGDLNSGTYYATFTIPNVYCESAPNSDPPYLKLPYCTSWHSNQGTYCDVPPPFDDVYYFHPDTKSKCVCNDNFTVPVLVEHPNIGVEKEADPTQLNEPGGDVTYTVTVSNPAQAASVTITQLTEDDNNDGTVDFTYTDSSTPSLSDICTSTTIPAGGSVTCTFTRTVSGNAGQNIVDKACVSGTDSNGGAVGPTCATATVSIKGVNPTANVTKTFNSLQCATVRYHVNVENTDLVEPLDLSALSDEPFGSIATVHDNILGTTCGVTNGLGTLAGTGNGAGTLPATIDVGEKYECDFDAYFCGSSNTNTVTATLTDNDYHCSAYDDFNFACLTNADCAAQTCENSSCSASGSVCTQNSDCETNTCVLNQITKTSTLTVNVAVTGHCSGTTDVCLVDANCPDANKPCVIP
jgi:hypothetical protein